DLDRAHDIRVLHSLAVAGFAKKACHGRAVLPQLLAQYLDGHGAMVRVMRAEHGRCAAFADLALERVTGNRLTDEIFPGHAANLTAPFRRGKRAVAPAGRL